MADDLRMALEDLLRMRETEDADFLREGVRLLAQELVELEVSRHPQRAAGAGNSYFPSHVSGPRSYSHNR